MALLNTNVATQYQGDGVTVSFAIPAQVIEDATLEIKVIRRDELDPENPVETLLTFGAMNDYTISGNNVVMNVAPLATHKLSVIRIVSYTQPTDFLESSAFPVDTAEKTWDKTVAMVQYLKWLIDRCLKVQITQPMSGLNLVIPPPKAGSVIGWNDDGTALINYDYAEGGGSGGDGIIGVPTDGDYGGPLGNPANIFPTDMIKDAVDKLDTLLSKIVPTPPEDLSQKAMLIPGGYMALAESSGASHYCTDDDTPNIGPGTNPLVDGFADATMGTLSAELDGSPVGSVALDNGDDTGIYSQLEIVADYDLYAGQPGKENIWFALIARIINSVPLSIGEHTARLLHTLTGNTPLLTFYVDDPDTPVISNESFSHSGADRYISGVPSKASGSTITAAFDVDNAVNTHYNATRIARATSPQTNAVDAALPGSPPADGATVSASINLTVAANAYAEDVSVSCIGYNSKGDTATSNQNTGIRVDTVSNESGRLLSGTGQYPSTGYGTAFDSELDVLSGNKELQLLNGKYQYPPAVDYSSAIPSGPDYSSLTPDAHNSMRWFTKSLGSITNASFINFAFTGSENFGGTAIISGMEIYIRVDGATPTTGWIDANAAYPGVGDPTADGDAALDVGNSTATSKRVTFGTAVKTGTVFVRVGIPSGSNKKFTNIT